MTGDLHDALEDLTIAGTPPADLAGEVLRGVARRRRNKALGTTVAAALLATAVAIPATLVHSGSRQDSAGSPIVGGPVILSFDRGIASATHPSYVWDPESHRYIPIPLDLIPSPDGKWGYLFDFGHQRWAVARWADAVHQRKLVWRLVGDPVEDPGGPGYSPNGGPIVTWAATGATLLEIAPLTRTITYLDPATMRGPRVHWPAQMTAADLTYVSYGVYGDQVTFTIPVKGKDPVVTVWSVDRQGKVTRAESARTGFGYVSSRDQVSPDGRYLLGYYFGVIDTQTHRAVDFKVPGKTASAASWTWYDNTHLINISAGHSGQPATVTIYDLAGHPVRSWSLTNLPDMGSSGIVVHLASAGPNTIGAVQITY